MNPNTETSNVPETIRQEAKAKALKIIEANKDCVSYIRPEDLETADLFIPIVSVIRPEVSDFYDPIPEVGIMAKPPLVNLIREKSGVNIVRTEKSKSGPYSFTAHCFGEKRMPDGSMATQDAIYEFDAELVAELDALSSPTKYPNEIAKRKHLLKIAKTGMSRAVTGAQHGLIHKLAHVARSFKTQQELTRGMIVSRVDRNINGIMADPEMRRAALDRMLGASEQVFGPQKQITRTVDVESGEVIEQPKAEEGQVLMFPEEESPKPEPSPVDKLKAILRTHLEKIPVDLIIKQGNVHELIQKSLDKKDATEIEINAWIDRCAQYFQNVQARNGGAS
jgi:hypothetical protein